MIAATAQVAQNSGMANPAAQLPERSPMRSSIRFEQPLNERMRTFLRIEFLYQQAQFHAREPADFSARAAISSLLDITTLLGRGDIRADVLKELDRHAEILSHYQRAPGVDSERLLGVMEDIVNLKRRINKTGTQFLTALKESEFLSAIKHRSTIPGGTCMFDLPEYGYWLHRPREERSAQLEGWLNELTPLCDAVAEVLWLTREAAEPTESVAHAGFFQHSLDRNGQYNLVRVLLPSVSPYFPEISAGQHRFTVRFVEWTGVEARPRQVAEDVRFMLSLC